MKENDENNWRNAVEHLEQFVIARFNLLRLKIAEKGATLGATLLSSFLVAMILLFCIIFGSITLAIFLGDVTGQAYLGFALITLLYVFIFILMSIKGKFWVKKKLVDFLIRKTYES